MLPPSPHDDPSRIADRMVAFDYWMAATELLGRSGHTATVRYDIAAWAAYIRSRPGTRSLNPALNPECSDLDATSAHWIDIRDRDGRRAAVVANRLMVVDDFAAAYASGHVHYARPTPEQRIDLLAEVPRGVMTGRIGHGGGLYVEDHARKQGFPWVTSALVRALSILLYDADRQCGALFAGMEKAGFARTAYRFTDCWRAVDGWFPPIGRHAEVFIMHMDRRDMVDQLAADTRLIRADRTRRLPDLAAIIAARPPASSADA